MLCCYVLVAWEEMLQLPFFRAAQSACNADVRCAHAGIWDDTSNSAGPPEGVNLVVQI